jgi:hypothetical protein
MQRSSFLIPVAIATASVSTLTGCERKVFPVAGNPVLILEGRGSVKVAAYDEKTKSFYTLGWFDSAGLAGKTVSDYDWSDDAQGR